MAKKSVVARQKKREQIVAKFAVKRAATKEELRKLYVKEQKEQADGGNSGTSGARIMVLQGELQDMPRDASAVRLRRRCELTGRPRGVYRKFGLGRSKLREFAMQGAVPGLKKASW